MAANATVQGKGPGPPPAAAGGGGKPKGKDGKGKGKGGKGKGKSNDGKAATKSKPDQTQDKADKPKVPKEPRTERRNRLKVEKAEQTMTYAAGDTDRAINAYSMHLTKKVFDPMGLHMCLRLEEEVAPLGWVDVLNLFDTSPPDELRPALPGYGRVPNMLALRPRVQERQLVRTCLTRVLEEGGCSEHPPTSDREKNDLIVMEASHWIPDILMRFCARKGTALVKMNDIGREELLRILLSEGTIPMEDADDTTLRDWAKPIWVELELQLRPGQLTIIDSFNSASKTLEAQKEAFSKYQKAGGDGPKPTISTLQALFVEHLSSKLSGEGLAGDSDWSVITSICAVSFLWQHVLDKMTIQETDLTTALINQGVHRSDLGVRADFALKSPVFCAWINGTKVGELNDDTIVQPLMAPVLVRVAQHCGLGQDEPRHGGTMSLRNMFALVTGLSKTELTPEDRPWGWSTSSVRLWVASGLVRLAIQLEGQAGNAGKTRAAFREQIACRHVSTDVLSFDDPRSSRNAIVAGLGNGPLAERNINQLACVYLGVSAPDEPLDLSGPEPHIKEHFSASSTSPSDMESRRISKWEKKVNKMAGDTFPKLTADPGQSKVVNEYMVSLRKHIAKGRSLAEGELTQRRDPWSHALEMFRSSVEVLTYGDLLGVFSSLSDHGWGNSTVEYVDGLVRSGIIPQDYGKDIKNLGPQSSDEEGGPGPDTDTTMGEPKPGGVTVPDSQSGPCTTAGTGGKRKRRASDTPGESPAKRSALEPGAGVGVMDPYASIRDKRAEGVVVQCVEGLVTVAWTWSLQNDPITHFTFLMQYDFISVGSGAMRLIPFARGVSLTPIWSFRDMIKEVLEVEGMRLDQVKAQMRTCVPDSILMASSKDYLRDIIHRQVNTVIPKRPGAPPERGGITEVWTNDRRAKSIIATFLASRTLLEGTLTEEGRRLWLSRLPEKDHNTRDVRDAFGHTTLLGAWQSSATPVTLPKKGCLEGVVDSLQPTKEGQEVVERIRSTSTTGVVDPRLEHVLDCTYRTCAVSDPMWVTTWLVTVFSLLISGTPYHTRLDEVWTVGLETMVALLHGSFRHFSANAQGVPIARDLVMTYMGTHGPKERNILWTDIVASQHWGAGIAGQDADSGW